MNKTILTVILAAFATLAWADEAVASSWTDKLDAEISVGYKSDYIYRGLTYANDVAEVLAYANYELEEGSLYAGFEKRRALKGYDSGNSTWFYGVEEINLIAGYQRDLCENYTIDLGTIYHWYTEKAHVDVRREFYAGVTYNGLIINPALYAFYEIDQESWAVELSGEYTYDLSEIGIEKTSLTLSGVVGNNDYNDLNGSQLANGSANGWAYCNFESALSYAVNDDFTVSGMVGYSTNSDKLRGKDNCIHTGISVGYKL